ncbi:hypothetical protein [Agrobacterium radiobacter]|uniref:hypothetical protein n=1 Tax=Agrobacterium radiobacter TaxID=362 RepID=UPI00343540CC
MSFKARMAGGKLLGSAARFWSTWKPISPDTMAIHHIQDWEVTGAPLWKEVAPGILRPPHPIIALAAHRAAFEQRYCTPRLAAGAPWICTWKCALRVWPELSRFSNQMLRYRRRPEGLIHEIGLPAHRAMPDAYVTARHLRYELNAARWMSFCSGVRSPACYHGCRPVQTGAKAGIVSAPRR